LYSNSDVPYDSTYIAKKDLPAVDADQLFNLPPGEVYGYTFWKLLCRFKIDGQKIRGKCKASHILISYEGTKFQIKEQRTKEEAKVKAEALLAQIKANRIVS
jgi:peptidyl-prolyl cis-trans isomerase D